MDEEDPVGAQEEVLQIATKLGIGINVGLAHQFAIQRSGILQCLCITMQKLIAFCHRAVHVIWAFSILSLILFIKIHSFLTDTSIFLGNIQVSVII